MCIEADDRQHKFFLHFFPEKVPCDKMSLAPIQKLIPDSIRSRKMIEGVFPIFSRNAFFDVSKRTKTQKAKFRAGGAEIARRGPPATSSRSAFAPLKTLNARKLMKGSPFFSKCVFDSFRLTTTFRESFCTIEIARFSLMTTFFCVTLHGDSDWNAQNVHRGRLQAT